MRAIKDYQGPLKEHEVRIFVRRGGPNYQEGLRVMGEVGKDHLFPSVWFLPRIFHLLPAFCWAFSRLNTSLWQKLVLFLPLCPQRWLFLCARAGKTTGIPIHVFGTETHMTAIVGMALGHRPIPNQPPAAAHTANFLLNASGSPSVSSSTPSVKGNAGEKPPEGSFPLPEQVRADLSHCRTCTVQSWRKSSDCLHSLPRGALLLPTSLVQKTRPFNTNVTLAPTGNLVI